MKRTLLVIFFTLSILSYGYSQNISQLYSPKSLAKMSFVNNSEYTMTLKIINKQTLYSTIILTPKSRKVVQFGNSYTLKLKIKAERFNSTSYHDGGTFSVTCTDSEWTEGEMSFKLSSHGTGLGPSISKKEFEKNN